MKVKVKVGSEVILDSSKKKIAKVIDPEPLVESTMKVKVPRDAIFHKEEKAEEEYVGDDTNMKYDEELNQEIDNIEDVKEPTEEFMNEEIEQETYDMDDEEEYEYEQYMSNRERSKDKKNKKKKPSGDFSDF